MAQQQGAVRGGCPSVFASLTRGGNPLPVSFHKKDTGNGCWPDVVPVSFLCPRCGLTTTTVFLPLADSQASIGLNRAPSESSVNFVMFGVAGSVRRWFFCARFRSRCGMLFRMPQRLVGPWLTRASFLREPCLDSGPVGPHAQGPPVRAGLPPKMPPKDASFTSPERCPESWVNYVLSCFEQ